MGDRGPAPKDRTVRGRDGKVNETLHEDGEVRGFDLPESALEEGEVWHPIVLEWWAAFRRSPQAKLVVTNVQWWELVSVMRVYQDFWQSEARWRSSRAATLQTMLNGYLISPAAARRAGIEITLPPTDPEEAAAEAAKTRGPGTVTSLDSRRARLLEPADDEPEKKKPAKKTVARKAPTKKAPVKRAPVKRAPVKKASPPAAKKVVRKAVTKTPRKT